MIQIESSGIEGLAKWIDAFPEVAPRAASIAINDTLRGPGLKLARQEIYKQVAFPKGYLEADRMVVGRFSTTTSLEGSLRGRERPTSLARFSTVPVALGRPKSPVKVMVKPGVEKAMKNAFFVPLCVGATRTDTVFNLGLAIRLPAGQLPEKSQAAVEIWPNVWLLYGPSVAQAFQFVAAEISTSVGNIAAQNFWKQFTRLSGVI